MRQSFRFPEPTLWALRKSGLKNRAAAMENRAPTLYEHLLGYEPVGIPEQNNKEDDIHTLPILNPQTGFLVNELASEGPSKA